MSKKYNKNEILTIVKATLSKPLTAYRMEVYNYTGETKDTKEKYTEVIAGWLLENEDFKRTGYIPTLTRKSSYRTGTHDGNATTGITSEDPPRKEERIALDLFGKNLQFIGDIKDYQTPLSNDVYKNAGELDLLGYNKESRQLNIIELKGPESIETLLRCIMEVHTYWSVVDKDKLRRDFNLSENANIRKAILVFEGTTPYDDFMDSSQDKITTLMKKLEIDLYVLCGSKNYSVAKAYLHNEDYVELGG
ncbi:MAG: hypothetical protein LBT08_01710 [Synergistaceae bacterium]|jgi:hypothetical protein|nr:hypothetical protein [Synergistaceae bacterium]